MDIFDNVAALFQTKPTASPTSKPITQLSPDVKLQDETYVYYGTRICGKVTASLPALSAFYQEFIIPRNSVKSPTQSCNNVTKKNWLRVLKTPKTRLPTMKLK